MIISVIMAAFNCENSVSSAIESILNQTFKDFEFIIIDDGSKDKTFQKLNHYKKIDNRIKLFRNNVNIGLTKSLNKAINLSQGQYIARQDADDISFPNRLEIQHRFLQINNSFAFCGCNGIIKENKQEILNFFTLKDIKKNLIVNNCFAHPSILIRKSILTTYGLYDERFLYGQDYELWCRLIYKYKLSAINLKDKLLILNNPINKLKEKNKHKIIIQSKNKLITILKYLKYAENKLGGALSILQLVINIGYVILFSKEKKN